MNSLQPKRQQTVIGSHIRLIPHSVHNPQSPLKHKIQPIPQTLPNIRHITKIKTEFSGEEISQKHKERIKTENNQINKTHTNSNSKTQFHRDANCTPTLTELLQNEYQEKKEGLFPMLLRSNCSPIFVSKSPLKPRYPYEKHYSLHQSNSHAGKQLKQRRMAKNKSPLRLKICRPIKSTRCNIDSYFDLSCLK